MALQGKRAYGRTVAVTPAENQRPDLGVPATQAWSSGAGVIGAASFGVLSKVADAALSIRAAKGEKDTQSGAAERQQQDLDGTPTLSEEQLQEHSQEWVRGYKKADGVLAIQAWQNQTAQELAKAEPDTDPTKVLNQRLGELMQGFTDPEVRASLLPLAQRAASQVKDEWTKSSMKESLKRQEEALTGIIRASFSDGSIMKDGALDELYKRLDSPEYAFLNRDDVSRLVIDSAKESAASGDGDPTKVRDFLQAHGLMDTGHADEVNRAVEAGKHVIATKENEARNVALAKMEFTLQDMADHGRLTDGVIRSTLTQAGITAETDPQQFTSAVRYWQNQQDQTLRRWEQEAKERARAAAQRVDLSSGSSFNYSDEQISKELGAQWVASAANPAMQLSLLRRAASNGWVVPQVQRILQRANPANAAQFTQAADLYAKLYAINPAYARKMGGSAAVDLDAHHYNVTQVGLSPKESVAQLNVPPREIAQAKDEVTVAAKASFKKGMRLSDGTSLSPAASARVTARAIQIAQQHGGIDGTAAITQAIHQEEQQLTKVNGRHVPNIGIPQGAEPALELYIKEQADHFGKDAKNLSVLPNKYDPSSYILVDQYGFAVPDPQTKGYIQVNPRELAAQHSKYEADKAEAAARADQRARTNTRTISAGAGLRLPEVPAPSGIPATIKRPDEKGSTKAHSPVVHPSFEDYLKN